MSDSHPADAARLQTRRAFGFVTMSALLPGSVQLFTGNRRVGRWATRVFGGAFVLLLAVALGLLLWRGPVLGLLLTPAIALILRWSVWILFAAWVILLLDSWRVSRPLRLPKRPRLLLTIAVLVVGLAVGGVASAAATALEGAGNVGEVFGGGGDAEVKEGRYNILLLGADAGPSREGLRPDSINVASVDATTGRTVLFGLPRNMQRVRFPESSPLHKLYPNGFFSEDGKSMLNGIYTLGEDHADLYPGKEAGLEAMKEAVSETLGLELNYFAMVDMYGFRSLIDAMGGIRLDVGRAIPVGGVGSKISGYIGPGENLLLNGQEALWFARSRADSSDYDRMARQKCVMAAMVKQLDPMTVATKFVDLSKSGSDILRTDVGRGEIATLAELALKAKDLNIVSVNFIPPMIVSADPDFELIHSTVQAKISEAEAADEAGPAPTTSSVASQPAPSQSKTTSDAKPSASQSSEDAGDDQPVTETGDLAAVCTVSS